MVKFETVLEDIHKSPSLNPFKMNTLLKNWQFICLAYALSALVAAPIYMKEAALAWPFYSAQLFIVVMTSFLVLMGVGLDRLLDEVEGQRPHQS